MRIQSKLKGTVDSGLFFIHYKGRKYLFFILKCLGDIIISYMADYAIFCTGMDFTKKFVMALDFADVNKNMSKGMAYRMPFNCYIFIYL